MTWFIKGDIKEIRLLDGKEVTTMYSRSLLPKVTKKDNMHKVYANKTSWCLTVRGKWDKTWNEINPDTSEIITLTNGRKVVITQ